MFKYKLTNRILLASGVFFYCLLATIPTKAQITPDGTVPTSVDNTDNQNFTITGGERAGNNLFHSFKEFSVPKGGSASFDNVETIENIFSRVTGGSETNIDGLIKTSYSANLFLINPNGIIFGENASLNIGGSFLATTASGIQFADGTFLSATDSQTTPILTVSVPIGLQFGETAGIIRNQSQATLFFPNENIYLPVGLTVQPGKTLALVGGDLLIDDGRLFAPGGRIELGSVGSFNLVDLTQINEGWALSYEQVQEFQNIQLSQASVITEDRSGNIPSGDIQLYGRAITITSSGLGGRNRATNPSGTLSIKASEALSITNSLLNTITISSGKAGDIEIETKQLLVSNGSNITTDSNGKGKGGNITIKVSDSFEIIGNNDITLLSTRANQSGNAGEINITTGKLILKDGGQISSSTFLEGDGGNVTVNASESVEISGQLEINGESFPSGLFAQTQTESVTATRESGEIIVNTKRLNVRDGGSISVRAVQGSQGAAKSLKINAQDITLDRGSLTAETRTGDQGNITLRNADTLLLRNNSQITTNAEEEATGGDITITSDVIALLDNSDITAKAVKGRGGNIQITTQGLFREPDSEISAASELGIDGTITINDPDVDPTSGVVELPDVPIDAEAILAQNLCRFEDEKIAKGSSFIITGRGGLTPTSAEPLENLDRVVRWANRDDIEVSQNGVVGVRQRSESDTSETGYPVIQQSQGWITTSDGSVWLIANAPETIPQNSGIVHPDCRAFPQ